MQKHIQQNNKQINFVDSAYNWKNITLQQYLDEGNIPSGWTDFFNKPEIKTELKSISEFLEEESKEGKTIYPDINHVFKCFYMTKLKNIKCILLGQDCYHNGAAVGLCFSVKHGFPINPSLRNINEELANCGYKPKINGNLESWAKQGVLLLNMALTVEKGEAESHSCIWYNFSKLLLSYIHENNKNIHYLLFGKHATDGVKHLSLSKEVMHITSHPSPLSANRSTSNFKAFIGSKIFLEIKNIKW